MSERAIGSGKWKKLRITILDRDGWQCAICNRPAHTVDHIIPRVKGGDMWAPDNLQSMCKSCNSSKGGRFFSIFFSFFLFFFSSFLLQNDIFVDFDLKHISDLYISCNIL